MKRSLISLALVALASGTHAETSVTLSGDLKVSGVYGNNGTSPLDGAGAAHHWRLNDDSSYFAMSGRQDLSGGLWAGFDLASFINVDNGGSSNPFWARHAVVQFGGGFGQIYAGRALTPSQLTSLLVDPWGWDGSIAQVGWLVQQANYSSTEFIRTANTIGIGVKPSTNWIATNLIGNDGN